MRLFDKRKKRPLSYGKKKLSPRTFVPRKTVRVRVVADDKKQA